MLLQNDYVQNASSDWECWFYFNEVWNENCLGGAEQPKPMETYNWQRSLLSADCFVILFTPYNLAKFTKKDFFLEVMYNHFYPAEKE